MFLAKSNISHFNFLPMVSLMFYLSMLLPDCVSLAHFYPCVFVSLLFLMAKIKTSDWLCLDPWPPLNVRDAHTAGCSAACYPASRVTPLRQSFDLLPLSRSFCRPWIHHYTLTTPEQQISDSLPAILLQGHRRKSCFCLVVLQTVAGSGGGKTMNTKRSKGKKESPK